MAEGITWIVVLAVIGLVFWFMVRENERVRNRSVQEYERDVANTKETLMKAGMLELDKFVGNTSEKRAAVEFIKDEEQGMTKTGGKSDDKDKNEG
jgi:hypothetical protein